MPDQTRNAAIDTHIQNDAFARFLGADVKIVAPGHSRVSLTVTEQMTNFHGITHGGLVFALGDLAFAAASNSRRKYRSTTVSLLSRQIYSAPPRRAARRPRLFPAGKPRFRSERMTSTSGNLFRTAREV